METKETFEKNVTKNMIEYNKELKSDDTKIPNPIVDNKIINPDQQVHQNTKQSTIDELKKQNDEINTKNVNIGNVNTENEQKDNEQKENVNVTNVTISNDLIREDYTNDPLVNEFRWKKVLTKLRSDIKENEVVVNENGVSIKRNFVIGNAYENNIENLKVELNAQKIREDISIEKELDRKGKKEISEENAQLYTKYANDFIEKLKKIVLSGHHSLDEIKMRVECFNSVYKNMVNEVDTSQLDDSKREEFVRTKDKIEHIMDYADSRFYEDEMSPEMWDILATPEWRERKERRKNLDSAERKFAESMDKLSKAQRSAPRSMNQHISARYKEIASTNRAQGMDSMTDEQKDSISKLDQWLLTSYLKKSDKLGNSVVFNFLNRPMRERLFAYYLIEHGYEKNISELTVTVSQTKYTPNIEKIEKVGFNLSKFKKAYENTCNVASLIHVMEESEKQKLKVTNSNKFDNDNLDLYENLEAVYRAIKELEEKNQQYTKCSRLKFFTKRKLKADVDAATKELYKKLDVYLNTKIQKTVNYDKGPEVYSVKEAIGDSLKAGTGLKSSGSMAASILKAQNNSAFSNTSYGANGLGIALGVINLSMAVISTIKGASEFSKLSYNAQAAAGANYLNQIVNPIYSMGSSSSGIASTYFYIQSISEGATEAAKTAAATAATAAQVIGGVGVMVGGLSALSGVVALKDADTKEEMRNSAAKKFEKLRRNNAPANILYGGNLEQLNTKEQFEKERTEIFEKNIIEIEKRIDRRNRVTAGCQIVSGICASGAGIFTVAGAPVVAGIMGLAGFLTTVGGSIATRVMKRQEYQKTVDECLGLDIIAKERFEQIKSMTGKYPGYFEKGRIRDQLRQEMMARCGYTRVKAFYADIMKTYAMQIYSKISPFLEKDERELQPVQGDRTLQDVEVLDTVKPTKEQDAYLDLVGALGLRVKGSKNEADRLPTLQMIYQKLMS